MLIKLNILKYIDKLVILTILFLFFSCHNSSDISFKNFDIVNLAESSYADEFIVLDVRTKQERANGFLANSTHIDFYVSRDFKSLYPFRCTWIAERESQF